MTTVAEKLKHEFLELIPPTVYFFVVLHFAAAVQALMNRHTAMTLPTSATITIAALVLGKSVLIADMLPWINRYPSEPLIWNIGWKALLYFMVAWLLHYLERLIEFWRKSTDFLAANHALFTEMNWSHFWAIQLLISFFIVIYCVLSELTRVLGRAEMKAIFFGPLPAKGSGSSR